MVRSTPLLNISVGDPPESFIRTIYQVVVFFSVMPWFEHLSDLSVINEVIIGQGCSVHRWQSSVQVDRRPFKMFYILLTKLYVKIIKKGDKNEKDSWTE